MTSDDPEPPPVARLTRHQYDGWACCWCGQSLLGLAGTVSAGISRGRLGVHVLDIEVYACSPDCPKKPKLRRPWRTGNDRWRTPETDTQGGTP